MKPVKKIQIAIDGPVGAGKSTVARLVAGKLNILYIDTGAMYRAAAYLALKHNLDLKDENKIVKLLEQSSLKILPPKKSSRFCTIILNGQDISQLIRTPELGWGASVVSTFPKIRYHLVKLQQQIAEKQNVIMEGRDITTVVLPKADLKIYLTGSIEERSRRKHKDLITKGIKKSYKLVLKETKKRDRQDSSRQADPLQVVPGAWILKTTRLTINQVVDKIIQRLQNLRLLTD